MEFSTDHITLKGVYSGIPKNISYFSDEIATYNQDPKNSLKLQKSMGFDQHRICKKKTTVKDISIDILKAYIEENNINRDEIDAVIVVSQVPDHFIPNMSSQIHGELGLSHTCFCLDVNDGCTGFLRGISITSMLLKSNQLKNVFLIAGDLLSRKVSVKDRNSFPLIGDAVTLSHFIHSQENKELPLAQIFHDGSGSESLMIPSGGLKEVPDENTKIQKTDEDGNTRSNEDLIMKGRDVFSFTQSTVAPFLQDYYSKAKVKGIHMIFSHQANEFIISRLRKKLDVSEDKFPSSVINSYGNSSSATIPLQILNEADKREKWGSAILVTGFGVGLSWSAACLNLDDEPNFKLIEGDY